MRTSRLQGHPAPPPQQSIEAVRRRARHRLIGAAVMVLVGVLGFPLLFDTQPRPIAVDIPIEIPSRQSPAVPAAAAPTEVTPSSRTLVSAADSLGAREEVVESRPAADPPPDEAAQSAQAAPAKTPDKPVGAPVVSTPPAAVEKTPKPASARPAGKPVDKRLAKAPAKAADKTDDKAAAGNDRIVVQVGAFAEAERAREARLKLERVGLKTYVHVADTPQGQRIRVRLGPFATRAEADKAAARAKALGLPAVLLWL